MSNWSISSLLGKTSHDIVYDSMARRIRIRIAIVGRTLESTLLGVLDDLRSAGVLFASAVRLVEKDQLIEAVIVLARDEDPAASGSGSHCSGYQSR